MVPKILMAILLALPTIGAASAPATPTAWDHLQRSHPWHTASATPLERLVLQRIAPAEFARYQGGAPASEILLLSGESLDHFLERNGGALFDLPWRSIDGGGGTSIGGDFSLSGTIGQHDVGISSGGVFRVTGGFWAIAADPSKLFCDGFESGTTTPWSLVFGEKNAL